MAASTMLHLSGKNRSVAPHWIRINWIQIPYTYITRKAKVVQSKTHHHHRITDSHVNFMTCQYLCLLMQARGYMIIILVGAVW